MHAAQSKSSFFVPYHLAWDLQIAKKHTINGSIKGHFNESLMQKSPLSRSPKSVLPQMLVIIIRLLLLEKTKRQLSLDKKAILGKLELGNFTNVVLVQPSVEYQCDTSSTAKLLKITTKIFYNFFRPICNLFCKLGQRSNSSTAQQLIGARRLPNHHAQHVSRSYAHELNSDQLWFRASYCILIKPKAVTELTEVDAWKHVKNED